MRPRQRIYKMLRDENLGVANEEMVGVAALQSDPASLPLVSQSSSSAVFALLASFNKNGTFITPSTHIAQELNLDSLAVMDLMMALEESFDICIPLNRIAEIQTVKDLVDTVDALCS